jgi:hypothetical protein
MVRPAIILEERCYQEIRDVILEGLNDELRYIESITLSDPIPLYSFERGQIYYGERALEQVLTPEAPVILIMPDTWEANDIQGSYELGDLGFNIIISAMTKPSVDHGDEDEMALQKRISRYSQALWNLLGSSCVQNRLSLPQEPSHCIKSFKVLRQMNLGLQRQGEVSFKGVRFMVAFKTVQ